MQHLLIERLAELADSEPTAAEEEHLAECAMCAAERVAYYRVVSMAADERRRIAPPITTWGLLSEELREQGRVAQHPALQFRQRREPEPRHRAGEPPPQRHDRVPPEIVVIADVDGLDQQTQLEVLRVGHGRVDRGIQTRTSESSRSTSSGLAM